MTTRCAWCSEDSLYIAYHDNEWGKPVYDDKTLFEFLLLEGAQAGLSWITILKRREGYREAFDDFDVHKIARYDQVKFDALMQNENIIRNRLKIKSAINNAQKVLALYDEGSTLSDCLWSFVGGKPIVNNFQSLDEVPAKTPLSDELSKSLKKRGFSFVGSTICYAFMQAVGMVNDHTQDCFLSPT